MDATISVTDADMGELALLRDELQRDPDLRGRAALSGGVPQPGTMGALTDVLTVALGPGGIGAAFAAVFVAWIRARKSSARFRVARSDGSVLEFSAERIRGLDANAVRAQAADLARFLDQDA